MKNQALSKTNPYLKDNEKRRIGLIQFVTSSSAIEGIHGLLTAEGTKRAKKIKSISSQKASKSAKSHR
jgi:hypothetical protein